MPLFGSRNRKSSRSLSPPTTEEDSQSHSPLGPLRSRNKRSTKGEILPLTTSAPPPPHFAPATSSTCNSFLLGGQYYPGKDKKRRHHLRKRSVLYRIFWSSPMRMVVSTIVISYLIVWHALVPAAGILYRHGLQWHSSVGEEWLLRDVSLSVPSLEEEQALIEQLTGARAQQHARVRAERWALLERIVPGWVHRNDPVDQHPKTDVKLQTKEKKDSSVVKGGDRTNEAAKEHLEKAKQEKHPVDNGKEPDKPPEQHKPPEAVIKNEGGNHQAAAVANGEHRSLVTLQNMHLLANDTRCPLHLSTDDFRTSLVIQASLDRVWVLEETCRRWKDPIIVVVGVRAEQSRDEVLAQLGGWKDKCPQLTLIEHKLTDDQAQPENYPINHLRNIGLRAVESSHVLLVDVDFVPSLGLDATIRSALQERQRQRLQQPELLPVENDDALVVPAFERVVNCVDETDCKQHLRRNSSFIPHSFDDLKACVGDKDCTVFQSDNNPYGHYSTRSEEWLAGHWYTNGTTTVANATYGRLRSIDCFHSLRYEPYVVIRWCPASVDADVRPIAPFYDERFHGYGKNKIEYVQHLRMAGYRFAVLPSGFIVHNPHVESTIKLLWNDRAASDLHVNMDRLYPKFLRELAAQYGSTSILPTCDG